MAKTKLRPGGKQKVYQYWLDHPRTNYAKIARIWKISRERVRQIINEMTDGQKEAEDDRQ